MERGGGYGEEASFVRSVVSPVVEGHYPSRANREVMSLYDLVAFAVMAHTQALRGRVREGLQALRRGAQALPQGEVQQARGEA